MAKQVAEEKPKKIEEAVKDAKDAKPTGKPGKRVLPSYPPSKNPIPFSMAPEHVKKRARAAAIKQQNLMANR